MRVGDLVVGNAGTGYRPRIVSEIFEDGTFSDSTYNVFKRQEDFKVVENPCLYCTSCVDFCNRFKQAFPKERNCKHFNIRM